MPTVGKSIFTENLKQPFGCNGRHSCDRERTFYFEGIQETPIRATLMMGDPRNRKNKTRVGLLWNRVKSSFQGLWAGFSHAAIAGSLSTDQQNAYKLQPFTEQITRLHESIKVDPDNAACVIRSETLRESMQQTSIDFIRNNGKSFVAPLVLVQIQETLTTRR